MRILILIIGMGIVTYIPRMLPAVLVEKIKFNKKTEKFLSWLKMPIMLVVIGAIVTDMFVYMII